MTIIVNGEPVEIGKYISYAQNNAETGAFQDKVKYRLCEQNNLILPALTALNDYVAELAEEIQPEPDVVYGFRIDSSESDPSAAVTYLADAVGMTPAHMDFVNGVFDWGSWEGAFFLPRPCMLRYDGTVDYYLDLNNYSKKADGTASDVSDFNYGGNAMMEWGRNGRQIWYKIVPDATSTSANIYIANYQADLNYRCWSFFDANNQIIDHFYTAIYNGTIDGAGRLRSISGKTYADYCQNKLATEEVAAAQLNNPTGKNQWYVETFADNILIILLTTLVSKTLDSQTAFGRGVYGQPDDVSSLINTGTLNDKGLFYGYNDGDHAVKVFGMENFWGNQWRRYAGHVQMNGSNRVKLTWGTADGSTGTGYVFSQTAADYSGYKTATNSPTSGNTYIRVVHFEADNFYASSISGGSSATYYCDVYSASSGAAPKYMCRGGYGPSSADVNGVWRSAANMFTNSGAWYCGAALSCKPEKEVI